MNNQYWFVDTEGTASAANPESARRMGFAMEYHFKALSLLEQADSLEFYLCVHPPVRLPRYGSNVVLVIVGDEYHVSYSYFNTLLAVLRCYGTRQVYLDGAPVNTLRLVSLIQYCYKSASKWLRHVKAWKTGGSNPGAADSRTLYIPLGCYAEYPASNVEPHLRSYDFGFLGSVGTSGEVPGKLREILPPPKIQARREMFRALNVLAATGEWKPLVEKTATFADSTARTDSFNELMAQTKISICPRGSNYETYRFFESFRAGCVVICEPLPNTWFYEGHPGLTIRDWTQLPALVNSLLRDPARLSTLAEASRGYWRDVLSERIAAWKMDNFLTRLAQPAGAPVPTGEGSDAVVSLTQFNESHSER